MKQLFIFAALCGAQLASSSTFAQESCAQLASAIDASTKEISYYAIDGVLDNSAPRATNRKLEQNIHVGLIQINLALMQAAKCLLPKTPVQQNAYRDNAVACSLASMRASAGDVRPIAECDRSTWVRSAK